MSLQHTLRLQSLALIAFGGMCFTQAGTVSAADCGCEPACDVCSCESSSSSMKHNCLYKALDAFAGGIEKLLKLDKCGCRESACDECCDAAMLAPMPPTYHHAHPMHGPATSHPPVPQREVLLQPMGPSQWEGYPRVPMTDAPVDRGQHLGDDVLKKRSAPSAVPPPVRIPESRPQAAPKPPAAAPKTKPQAAPKPKPPAAPTPAPKAAPKQQQERGSLFDTLSDPFGDDEASLRRSYRPVRPTSYLENAPRPVQRRPLP